MLILAPLCCTPESTITKYIPWCPTQDATGARVREARIDENEPAAFAAYFKSLPEASRVVMEACWNWGWL